MLLLGASVCRSARQTEDGAVCAAHPHLSLIAIGTGSVLLVRWLLGAAEMRATLAEEATLPSLLSSMQLCIVYSDSISAAMLWHLGTTWHRHESSITDESIRRPLSLSSEGLAQDGPGVGSVEHRRGRVARADFHRNRWASGPV